MTLLGCEGSQNLANKSQWAFGSVPFPLLSLPLRLVCSRLGMSSLQRLTKQIQRRHVSTEASPSLIKFKINNRHFVVPLQCCFNELWCCYKNAQLFISRKPKKEAGEEKKKKWCGLFSGIRLHSLNNWGHVDEWKQPCYTDRCLVDLPCSASAALHWWWWLLGCGLSRW